MSVSGILTAIPVSYSARPELQRSEKFKQQFHQLGEDLRARDLAAAQADFATIKQFAPEQGPSTQGEGLLGRAFDSLADDLQTGDFASAKRDYSTIHQIFQSRAHEQSSGGIGRMVDQLAHEVRSGDLAAAQQAYGVVQNVRQRFAETNGLSSNSNAEKLSTNA
jgi:hypothetical protein